MIDDWNRSRPELMTPRQYFDEEVTPPVKQFLGAPGVTWKARCAAVALTSMIDWTFEYCRENRPHNVSSCEDIGDFRKEMINQCDSIRPVRDIADGMRHRFLTRQLDERVVTTATGAWDPDDGRLKLKSDGGYFDDLVREVWRFWDSWIARQSL